MLSINRKFEPKFIQIPILNTLGRNISVKQMVREFGISANIIGQ
jgi:hypothetical protein